MTFSIAARAVRGDVPEWGVAVASKFLAVGAAVPWCKVGAGAVATQALANLAYGPDGLDLLAAGNGAESVIAALTTPDPDSAQRQLGIVDAKGNAATYTGSECLHWAGGRTGQGYCCQGNILAGPQVIDGIAAAFEETGGELASRLLAAVEAGDAAGGDRRGRQSAALIVARDKGGYGGGSDIAVDLRIDDHAAPVQELQRLYELHKLYFPSPEDLEFIDVDVELAAELRALLSGLGYAPGASSGPYDHSLRAALYAYAGTENLEERWSADARIERAILEHLRGRTAR